MNSRQTEFHAKELKQEEPYLPGYYRARKQWDLVVIYKGALVAAIELKSQVKEVGKNINNRFEEALGTATDTLASQVKNHVYGEIPPWLGYVFVLAEDAETEKKNRSTRALYQIDGAFLGTSYNERYQEMVRRFVSEKVYDAAWFIATDNKDSMKEPLVTATARTFAQAIAGRVDLVRSIVDN